MLILILINVQCLRTLFLALKKIRMVKSISRQIPTTQQKIPIPKFAIALTWGNFYLPMNTNLVNLCIIMIKCLKKILKTDHEK